MDREGQGLSECWIRFSLPIAVCEQFPFACLFLHRTWSPCTTHDLQVEFNPRSLIKKAAFGIQWGDLACSGPVPAWDRLTKTGQSNKRPATHTGYTLAYIKDLFLQVAVGQDVKRVLYVVSDYLTVFLGGVVIILSSALLVSSLSTLLDNHIYIENIYNIENSKVKLLGVRDHFRGKLFWVLNMLVQCI